MSRTETWYFYKLSSGIFNGDRITCSVHKESEMPKGFEVNIPKDCGAILGVTDWQAQRVDNGKLVAYQPPAPNEDHEWNDKNKRWVLKKEIVERARKHFTAMNQIAALEAKQPRLIREHLLKYPDALDQLQKIDDEIVKLRKNL